ncbi:MAG: hypothetical protein LBT44_10620 [Clostridiales bacterium]|jgi:hypothetical protein|nr:hypothetical protein [Clostridiales bacterium]
MDGIEKIFSEIEEMFFALGFHTETINHSSGDELNYVFNNLYCIPHCVDGLGFLIEYANSYEEALINDYCDGDSLSLDLTENEILAGIKQDVLRELQFVQSEVPKAVGQ